MKLHLHEGQKDTEHSHSDMVRNMSAMPIHSFI